MLEKKRKELEYEYIKNGLSKKALYLSQKLDEFIFNEQVKKLKKYKMTEWWGEAFEKSKSIRNEYFKTSWLNKN